MPAQVFGAQATAVELYIAFYGAAPSNPIYNNLLAVTAASSPQALALTIGNQFATTSDADLAKMVLANLGISAGTTNQAAYDALLSGLTAAFGAYPTARGIVVLNLANILTTLETNATYGGAAQTFNQSVTNAYIYASNTANTQTQTLGNITTTSPLTVNAGDIVTGTSGNDNINGNLFFNTPSGTFFQTLNTGDSVNGGAGTDTLNLGFNNGAGQNINATLTSIETLAVNATGTANTTIDMTNGTGLSSISVTNGQLGGDIVLNNVGTLLTSASLTATLAGLTVNSTAATVAGTADAIALNLSQAGSTAVAPTVSLAGYETINLASNGPATNNITLAYSAGATVKATGSTSLSLSTGTSTNAITVDASGMTGTGALTLTASGGANTVTATGTANNDTFTFSSLLPTGSGTNAAGTNTYTTADTVNGAAGTDTIGLAAANVNGVTANQSNLSNLEVVAINDAVTAGTYTPALFGGATGLTLAYNAGTGIVASTAAYQVNYGAGTSSLTLLGSDTGAATLFSSGSATNDVLNLAIGGATSTGLTEGTFATTGFETINLASNGALGVTNTITSVTMTATAATEVLNITGARSLTITGSVTADQINASAFTGNLNMGAVSFGAGLSGGVPVTNAGMQITGGSGNDTLFGSDGADQIVGGAGNDRILFGTNVSQGDIVTGGDGSDQFRFTAAVQSSGTAQIVKITDFVAGTDKIGLIGIGGATAVTVNSAGTIATADTLTQVWAGVGAVTGSAGTTDAVKVVTVSAGLAAGTYLFIDANTNNAVDNAADMLINITGVTGTVSAGDFVFV